MKFNMKVPVPEFLKSVKYTLAAVNGIFLVTGILILIIGSVSLATYYEYDGLITKTFFTVPGFVIATGVIIFFTSILGFYGAISEQFYFILVYFILLVVILVFEVSMAIVAYGMRGNAASQIQSTMLESLSQYSARIEVARLWDDLQREFQCCGVVGRFDFASFLIPISCCHIDYGVVGTFTCETSNAHATGCAVVLGELLSYHAYIIAVAALLVACMQVPITALAGWMAYRTKYQEVELES